MFSRALFAFATISGALAITCETSNGSPSTADARSAALFIQNKGSQSCCQYNPGGSLCTTMATAGSAAVGICGTWDNCISCGQAGSVLLSIANSCQSNGKSGGQAPVGNGLRVILFHH